MANNTTLPVGAGGDTIRDIDRSGVKTPVSLIDIGTVGTENLLTAGQGLMTNSVPVAIASNQTAIPVSATSLPLPTGASTSAKQPALGTAGVSSTDVISVQGITSGTALPISGTISITADSLINIDQIHGTAADTNSGSKSAGTLRVVLATDQPQLTNKLLVTPDSVALPANQSVNVSQLNGTTTDTNSGPKSAGTIRVVLATDQPALTNKLLVTPDSVALPANQSVNVSQLNGTTTDTNSGVKSAGTMRVVLATDQPALTNALKVDGSAVTQPISGNVGLAPQTSGGSTPYGYIAAASTNQDSQSVKGSAGQVFGWALSNTNAAARWVKIYDKATAPTSADTPKLRLIVPGNGTIGGGNNRDVTNGLAFALGIGIRITTGVADNDGNAVAANEVVVNLDYK